MAISGNRRSPNRFFVGAFAGLLLASALSVGAGLAQLGGCARCSPASPTASGERRFWPGVPTQRRVARWERRRVGLERGGSYTVCVRLCDGGFFPVTYSGSASRADGLASVCQSLCPNAEVKLYSFPLGGTIDEAVSATGESYADLPNADKFEQSYDPRCSCRRPGQSWADALAAAEAKYGHSARDILVTPEKSAQLSRPVESPNSRIAAAALAKSPGSMESPADAPLLNLDVNGVDTELSAAAASLSRETSGIRGENVERRVIVRLNQGRTVEEQDPNGAMRRVRIVGPTF